MRRKWKLPTLLAGGLAAVLLISILWAGSTSITAFSAYNSEWDGGSTVRAEADAAGGSSIVATDTEIYEEVQSNRTAAIVLSPNEPYTNAEADRLQQFVSNGGTLIVADDFGSNANSLLAELGFSTRVDGRPVRDNIDNTQLPDFVVATQVTESDVTENVEQITLNHGSVLEPNGASVLVQTSSFAYLDTNRNGELDDEESVQRYPVVTTEQLGDGRAVIISDPSVFINAMMEREGNARFAQALFSGHETVVFDHSHSGDVPQFIRVVLALQQNPLLQALIGLGLLGVIVLVSAYLPSILAGRRQSAEQVLHAPRGQLREGLVGRHPEWDEDRLNRLMKGFMTDENKERKDD